MSEPDQLLGRIVSAATDLRREINRAVAAERERCARIVESFDNTAPDRAIAAAAAEIRSGR